MCRQSESFHQDHLNLCELMNHFTNAEVGDVHIVYDIVNKNGCAVVPLCHEMFVTDCGFNTVGLHRMGNFGTEYLGNNGLERHSLHGCSLRSSTGFHPQ
ncbi:hypothetical protein CEXT_41011 [Caerostris extrusa]|uniref:Uncharacterized protein n=1 Tax=Caerostris extrusa TaxID=172846 RepID=A0AAV4QAS0_CAEEX|nr:hypothetical protein CEXT_41011 [Caerostris extrusa]